jgi:hypothetical protein
VEVNLSTPLALFAVLSSFRAGELTASLPAVSSSDDAPSKRQRAPRHGTGQLN